MIRMSIKMKRYFWCIIPFASFFLIGCIIFNSSRDNDHNISIHGFIQNPKDISMKVISEDITQNTATISITITNQADLDIYFAENVTLEKYENKKWISIANIHNMKEIVVFLESGKSYNWTIPLESIYPIRVEKFNQKSKTLLKKGEYRFVKDIHTTEKTLIASSFAVN